MDPIHFLAIRPQHAEAMRTDLYARFGDDTIIRRIRRTRRHTSAVWPSGIRRLRRRTVAVAVAQ